MADNSIERHLIRIQRRGTVAARQWATASLAVYDAIRATRMTAWLTPIQQSRLHAMARLIAGPVRVIVFPPGKLPIGRILGRAAGPFAIVAITAWEAYQISQLYGDYRDGRVDYRTFVRQASRVGGGALGALGGATGGAVAGMWIGTFGGPVAWITIPAGGIIGGTIGGVVGYFAGSWVGGTAADWYLTSLDAESQRQLGEKLLVLSWSELEQLRMATLR